ncbi:hypothetical protein [Pseudarthrobacter sulfonivorans]|uniref:hypothetical protein n=1 Tax=Pseudarthrobacter sulfonivorans TaxID=121292 RepID=UPI002102EB6E|nr:hypothetical protein [Pseudarthrobacter sulfonivorans]
MSRITRTRIAVAAVAAFAISCGGPAANAFWQTLSSKDGAARADSIQAMAAPAASGSAGAASLSWARGSTVAGRTVSGYTVARYSAATAGTKVEAGGGCAGTVTTLGCNEALLPAGTWFYTVTPVLGSWVGPESARSIGVFVADTTKPDAPAIIAPAFVNSLNASSVPVRGTAEPSSTVTVTARDTATPQHTATQVLSTDASGDWTAANFNMAAFKDGAVNYSATAKDAAGNVSDPGLASSTKEVVVPTVSAVILSNGGSQGTMDQGDKVTLRFSEQLDPSTICSSWTNPGDQLANGANQVVVTVSGGDVLTLTVEGCTTLRVGSVGLNGDYAGTGGLTFQGTDTGASTLAWNATGRELTITLGGRTGAASNVNGNVKPTYTPGAGLTDIAGNPLATTPVTGGNSRF